MELKLPPSIVSHADLLRIARLLENRDGLFITSDGTASKLVAPADKPLEDLAALNGVDLMQRAPSQQLKTACEETGSKLPQLHMSFAVEPSEKVVETLITWLRANIHPSVLLRIGLQPSIAAGCVLRTPNKIFDFSLRNYIHQQDEYLVQLIKGAVGGK